MQRAVKLERMYALFDALEHPELRYPSVLVAGTKGKGSTVAMLSACLAAGGYRTGRYTSPHLVNWRERTTIDGQPISTQSVLQLIGPVRSAVKALSPSLGIPTTFEVGTALSLLYFARQAVDVAVVEVGTGGRFDATNLVDAIVSVIAPISYDHTQTLGTTLTSISWHKAGIMRWRRPAVSAPQTDEARAVILAEAKNLRVPLAEVGRDWRWSHADKGIRVNSPSMDPLHVEVGLAGEHQLDNATTAIAALHAVRERFSIGPSVIAQALKNVDWPGRLQVLGREPQVVLDGAHNAASAEVVRRALDHDFRFDRLLLVLGLSEGKDALGVVGALAPRAQRVYLTRAAHERSAPPAELAPLVRSAAPRADVQLFDHASSALEAALKEATPRDLVLVTGSLFLVGEVLAEWRRSSR